MKDLKLQGVITGLNVEFNDLVLDEQNDLKIVEGAQRIKQDIIKILFTPLGQNWYYLDYGSNLENLVSLNLPLEVYVDEIINTISSSISYLSLTELSKKENINQIDLLEVKYDDKEKAFIIKLIVSLLTGEKITLNFLKE